MKTATWFWWKLYYALAPRHRNIREWVIRAERTRSPWWKFKPSLFHNTDGRMWQISLSDERYYVERRDIRCDVYISCDTGNIIGLNLFDEELAAHEATQISDG